APAARFPGRTRRRAANNTEQRRRSGAPTGERRRLPDVHRDMRRRQRGPCAASPSLPRLPAELPRRPRNEPLARPPSNVMVLATPFRAPTPNDSVLRRGDFIAPVLHEIHRVIVGQDYLVNRL